MTEFGGYLGLFNSLDNEEASPKTRTLSYIESANKIIKSKHYDAQSGITVSTDMRLSVLQPTEAMMPTKDDVRIIEYVASPGLVRPLLNKLEGILAVDIETNGTQAGNRYHRIVGIGIASGTEIMYFDFETNSAECNQLVLDFLSEYDQGLVGHNVFFDGTFLLRDTGVWLDWQFDTYALFRQLANEGYTGFRYGLKDAQINLLGWDTKGDVELDQWLVKHGHIVNPQKKFKPGLLKHVDPETGEVRYGKAKKWMMHKAPAQVLGYYCGLDAASTWMLLHEVFLPSIEGQCWADTFLDYHCKTFMTNVKMLANQQLTGITINRPMLEKYQKEMGGKIQEAADTFLNHPDVRPFADEMNRRVIDALEEKEPAKYKKQPKISAEPKRLRKDGTISKTWENWAARKEEIENTPPEVSKNWLGWQERHEKASTQEHLNPNSGPQLQELFYDHLGFPIKVLTDTEEPSTGAKALPGFGEVGQLLKQVKLLEKELTYVNACLEHLIQDEEGDWRLHPQFRVPGTLTCRLAGSGGLNLQQIPKSRGYLECWHPKPGKAWVDCDHSALEQVVMAELSRDESLLKIYGPDAKSNDIYLFNGSQLPGIGETIRASGYDPDNPLPDLIAKTKKECKKERHVSKVITLGSSYGMGPGKLKDTLEQQGILISEDEARSMHKAYWELYGGVKQYEKFLLKELKERNGYVLNGIGRPVCCAEDSTKDIVNRVVQSTGHDVHMFYVCILEELFEEHGLNVDGLVWDFHDQSIVECDEEHAELVAYLMGTKAYEILNDRYLDGLIPLKGDPVIIKTMADAKCE